MAKGLAYDPTFQRYVEPYMDDNDAKNTGNKYRMIPIFEKAVTMAAATKGTKLMVGSGVDGSTFPHGTQALEFEQLVKRAGVSPARAIQSGTIVNAEVLGGPIGSGRSRRASSPISSPFRTSARRHHRASTREVRDEGRQDHPQRARRATRQPAHSGRPLFLVIRGAAPAANPNPGSLDARTVAWVPGSREDARPE